MRDFTLCSENFNDQNFKSLELMEIKLGEGCCDYKIIPEDNLFYKIISEEANAEINSDLDLIKFMKEFSCSKNKYLKIKDALLEAEQNGYGIVMPTMDEMNLEEPILVKKGGKYKELMVDTSRDWFYGVVFFWADSKFVTQYGLPYYDTLIEIYKKLIDLRESEWAIDNDLARVLNNGNIFMYLKYRWIAFLHRRRQKGIIRNLIKELNIIW